MNVFSDAIRLKALQKLMSEADLHCYPGLDNNSNPNVVLNWKSRIFQAPDVFGLLDIVCEDLGDEWLKNLQ